jgi:hypothetical protein
MRRALADAVSARLQALGQTTYLTWDGARWRRLVAAARARYGG